MSPSAKYLFFLLVLCGLFSSAQIKIGDNVSTIDNGSILELESNSKALVLPRLTNDQMNALTPLPGGLIYNIDTNCVHSYSGVNWVNLCNSESGAFSFSDNNDGSFTINYSDGTSFTSSDLTGPRGSQGLQGEMGDTGNTGPQGIAGEKGDTGDAGTQGEKGDTGDAGPQGLQGEKGDTGDTGPQGIPGEKGDTGDTGLQGIQGEKGDTGDTGLQGIQGEKGDTGDAGLQGIQGETGDTGDAGLQGIQGEKGDAGDAGPQGIPGEKGDPGDPATDDQQLSTNNVPGQISITGGNEVILNVDDADNNSSNEIQTLSIIGSDLSISGTGGNTITLPPGGTAISGTQGSLFFANTDSTPTEDNTNLFWDNANDRLGVGINQPSSQLQVAGSFATGIIRTTTNLALNEIHHTVILDGNHNITLPSASTSTGRMYIIKNPTSSDTSISQYQDQTGTSTATIPQETIVWLQSDGTEWQLINNIQASGSSSGGSGGGTGGSTGGGTGGSGNNGNGTNGTSTADLVSDFLDDGQNGPANNFSLQIRNATGNATNYEALIENAPYATIPNLNLTNHTYQVIDNGDGTFNHIFTSTSALGGFQGRTITGGNNISPPGSGLACGCVSFYAL